MKKTYLNPKMEIIIIETNSMLCLSGGMGGQQSNSSALGHENDDDFDW